MATKVCPNYDCHFASFVHIFCPKCGKALVDEPLHPAINFPCPECKASVFLTDTYCGTCGKKIVSPYFVFVFQDKKMPEVGSLAVANNIEKAWRAFAGHIRRTYPVESAKRYYRITGIFQICPEKKEEKQ